MAGSYRHVTTEDGHFRDAENGFHDMIENLGDAYEAIEEMWWMIEAMMDEFQVDAGEVALWARRLREKHGAQTEDET